MIMSGQQHDYGVTGGGPVMAIFAHPDDPEFVAGGALARWAAAGRKLIYVIITDGSKGSSDPTITTEALISTRQQEQRDAAHALDCEDVVFLPYEDAMLEPTMDVRRDLVREIRRYRPEIVVCFDPTVFWVGDAYIQHPDHRASGEAALAALFPAARDRLTFPELLAESLEPHNVDDIYLASPANPNRWIDISETIERKIAAMAQHRSQVADPEGTARLLRAFAREAGQARGLDYAEAFRFISFNNMRGQADEGIER
jgi:LmbE family N-acetylglucosaminyl deacetylase